MRDKDFPVKNVNSHFQPVSENTKAPIANKPQNILQRGEKKPNLKDRLGFSVVEIKGLEPMTSRMWTERSNQLS